MDWFVKKIQSKRPRIFCRRLLWVIPPHPVSWERQYVVLTQREEEGEKGQLGSHTDHDS
jgi:hypothetical protein